MNYFILSVLTIELMISCLAGMPCRQGSHPFGVILTPKPEMAKLIGLDKYTYTFFLISSYANTINDYQIAFRASFPININFSLNHLIAYQFTPENFCLNFLIKEKVSTLKGRLMQYDSKQMVVSGISVRIDEMLLNLPIDKDKPNSNIYFIMSTVYLSQLPTQIILMKKLMGEADSFYQLVTAEIDLRRNASNEESLRIGTETLIQSISGSRAEGMVNGRAYLAIMSIGSDLKYFKFAKVNSLICIKESTADRKCPFIS